MDARTERTILEAIEAARAAGGPTGADDGDEEPLPTDVYADEAIYRAEVERIFWRSWVPVALTSELSAPETWILRKLGRADIVVARDAAGALHAFHNTCIHRGSTLVEREGCGKRVTCPYHGFSYTLDGRLASAPDATPAPGHRARLLGFSPSFDIGRMRLGQIAVDTAWGFVWVNLRRDAPGLAASLGPALEDELANFRLEELEHKGRVERDEAFDWKLGVEGFAEPYHVAAVHKRSIHPVIHYRLVTTAGLGDHSRMVIPLRDPRLYESEGTFGRVAARVGVHVSDRLNTVQRTTNIVYFVWPNVVLNFLPNHVVVFRMMPSGPMRTRAVLDLFGAPGGADVQRAFWGHMLEGYEAVFAEDCNAFTAVQRGLSGAFHPPLALSRYENLIRHFRARRSAWLAEDHAR